MNNPMCVLHREQRLRTVYYLDYEGIPQGSRFKKVNLFFCPKCKTTKEVKGNV